ncbi:hypothetical protein JCM8547_002387 [Rhodosporidiobolus lusitaniae]
MLPSPRRPPTKRRTVLLLALSACVFHAWLAGRLGAVGGALSGGGGEAAGGAGAGARDDAGDFEKRLGGVGALLGIGKLWSWCSAGVAGAGAYGVYKDRPSLLRLFVLNSFLSLLLDAFLLALILLLLTLGSPSSSSSVATTLCQALSASPSAASGFSLSLFGLLPTDFLGLTLESCEDRFDGVLITAVVALAVVEGARAWGAVQVLGYYGAVTSTRQSRSRSGGRSDRQPEGLLVSTSPSSERYYDEPLELDGPHSAGGRKRRDSFRRDRSTSGSSSRHSHYPHSPHSSQRHQYPHSSSQHHHENRTRILLLPRPEERAGGQDVPALALTASSPVRSTFPPAQAPVSHVSPKGVRDKGKVLVYAPVYMTPEEARTCGATELVLSSSRTRSYSGSYQSSSSSSSGTARSRSSTLIATSLPSPSFPPPPVSSPPRTSQQKPLQLDTTHPLPSSSSPPSRGQPSRNDSEGSDMATPVAVRAPALQYQQQQSVLEVLGAEEGGGKKTA